MKFEMNGFNWIIKEVSQEAFLKYNKKRGIDGKKAFYYGRTMCVEQEIWLFEDLSMEQKRRTLYHELMHCYLACYISSVDMDEVYEEVWCDISSNSHDIIHEITEKYFKKCKGSK